MITSRLIVEFEGHIPEDAVREILSNVQRSHPHVSEWAFSSHKWIFPKGHLVGLQQFVFLPVKGNLTAWQRSLNSKPDTQKGYWTWRDLTGLRHWLN